MEKEIAIFPKIRKMNDSRLIQEVQSVNPSRRMENSKIYCLKFLGWTDVLLSIPAGACSSRQRVWFEARNSNNCIRLFMWNCLIERWRTKSRRDESKWLVQPIVIWFSRFKHGMSRKVRNPDWRGSRVSVFKVRRFTGAEVARLGCSLILIVMRWITLFRGGRFYPNSIVNVVSLKQFVNGWNTQRRNGCGKSDGYSTGIRR